MSDGGKTCPTCDGTTNANKAGLPFVKCPDCECGSLVVYNEADLARARADAFRAGALAMREAAARAANAAGRRYQTKGDNADPCWCVEARIYALPVPPMPEPGEEK